MAEWIAVSERLPDEWTLVLVNLPIQFRLRIHGEIATNAVDIGQRVGDDWYVDDAPIPSNMPVTHWMPLPDPPTEETK